MLIDLPIEVDLERIATFCRERGIARLSLFGSVLRKDFNPERSDIDVLVEFRPDVHPGLKFFGYGDELTEIIGHKVDLCSRLNKYIEAEVRQEAVLVYEQA